MNRSKETNSKRTMKTTEYMWSNGKSAYLLNLIAEENKHDDHVSALKALLRSFENGLNERRCDIVSRVNYLRASFE